MAQNKTAEHDGDVQVFLSAVKSDRRREDAKTVMAMLEQITGQSPKMWGPNIIGFDRYHYLYESGREGDSFMIGLSSRSQNLSIYVMPGFEPYADLMARLGKHKTGASCLYINKLDDIDLGVLEALLARAYSDMKKKYRC